jgi:phospho-N-acetylmuramoyl-pentapeptide-transferase
MRLVVMAAGIAFLLSFSGTPLLIRWLKARRLSQAIRQSTDTVKYPEHSGKRGTPSMGGIAIVGAVVLAYFATHLIALRPVTASGLLALYLMVGLAVVGVVDDYLKVFKRRSTGLRAHTKLGGQAIVALSFAAMAINFPDSAGYTPATTAISFVRDTAWVLPVGLGLLWIWLIITATTNAVNLTDGLDGLLAGAAVMTFAAYTIMSVWQYGQDCSFELTPTCYQVRDPLDLAIFAAACAGACFGFLWWNTSPAGIFMGDAGSLALGGAIAALAILTRTELLLPLLAGLFVLEAASVIIQVGSFKLRGKRVFPMTPIHHTFELLDWPEVKIVVRFWIIQGAFIGAGMAIFYAEWVRQ